MMLVLALMTRIHYYITSLTRYNALLCYHLMIFISYCDTRPVTRISYYDTRPVTRICYYDVSSMTGTFDYCITTNVLLTASNSDSELNSCRDELISFI